ncbi:MAG: hypothetical protein LBU83_12520 [Bacteroidales bacterium]|nr:hypothetical protein [Bacteroidales bacterium]
MNELAISFWEQVNQLIKTQKTTQKDLAKSLNIPFGTYRGWNAYKRLPDVYSGSQIAQALKTTVEYLLTGKSPEGIPPEILETARKIAAMPIQDREEIMLVRYENSSTLKRIKIKESKKDGRRVFLYWEDGSGDFKQVDSSEYEIQGEFYRNLGK